VSLFLGIPNFSMAGQWYVGGTLQYATVSQWQEASYIQMFVTLGKHCGSLLCK